MFFIPLKLRHLLKACALTLLFCSQSGWAANKLIVYVTPGLDLPFWRTLGAGIKSVAEADSYQFQVFDSNNNVDTQEANIRSAIKLGASGIVLSPTDSASAQTMLGLTSAAHIPMVIADIGTNGGDFVSYVKSDNYKGAYGVGKAVAIAMKERGYSNGEFALCTIALNRKNGQDRTNGFLDAMKDAGFNNKVAVRQMQTYTKEESYQFVLDILHEHPKLKALFVEVDKPTLGALQALKEKKKLKEIIVGSFDGIPEFVDYLRSGALVAVGMQQPFLMGTRSAEVLLGHIAGTRQAKQVLVPVLDATARNIPEWLPIANKTVFGNEK